MQCIHHKLKSQISYDNVLLLSIVIHRKVFPSWMHLSYILGPRFVRTKFSPQKNRIGRHPPLGYFIAQHLPPLQSWSRPATCWPEKYPPSGGKPHAHLCMGDYNIVIPKKKTKSFHNQWVQFFQKKHNSIHLILPAWRMVIANTSVGAKMVTPPKGYTIGSYHKGKDGVCTCQCCGAKGCGPMHTWTL